MRKLYIGTNTKMYKTISETVAYLQKLAALTADIPRSRMELFVIPSFTALDAAGKCIPAEQVTLGAQNMGWEETGPFTGEISPLMLREVGVRVAELGHSERRHLLGETDAMINRKVLCALRNGLTPLLCIGETREQKESGIADETLRTQLKLSLQSVVPAQTEHLWIAYEPVWAIGASGVPATSEYAEERHHVIRRTLTELFGKAGAEIPLLYGGSVNNENARELSAMQNIDGLFIGRSAWDADHFNHIIRDVLAVQSAAHTE